MVKIWKSLKLDNKKCVFLFNTEKKIMQVQIQQDRVHEYVLP